MIKEYAELPPVYCDDRQIKLVFYNIFQNAQQAMENGGILTVRTFPRAKSDGLYAAISVSDTGGRIAAELVYNIFNPFFTTKEQGTGLGLSIAQTQCFQALRRYRDKQRTWPRHYLYRDSTNCQILFDSPREDVAGGIQLRGGLK